MNIIQFYTLASEILIRNFKESHLPFKYFLVVTKSCGSRCSNCLIWKEIPKNELSLDEFELLAKNSRSNLVWLNLSGGEPTDRSDLVEIIQKFVEYCPKLQMINFTTNGLNLPKLKEACEYLNSIDIPIKGINVSIDGPPSLHDTIRGTPNGHEMAIEALQLVRSYKNIRSAAAMTLFPSNHKLIPETVESIAVYIKNFNLKDLHLNFPHTSSHYYGNEKINYKDRLDIKEASKYFKDTLNLLSPFELVERIYQRKLIEFTKTGITPMKCAALSSNIYISEHGDIYPCTIWDKKIGSLRKDAFNLSKILHDHLAIETKKQILAKKCPNCWTPCEAFPSLITDLRNALKSIL